MVKEKKKYDQAASESVKVLKTDFLFLIIEVVFI